MKNRDLFLRDPASLSLLNDGQARIDDARTEKERRTLREELQTFVCEGQYASGMLRILESFTKHISSASQPAAWVSGFFGSGKSHLLKMLCHLWVNTEFPEDGATARSLVPSLPDEIEAALRELDILGKRCGGLRAASGTLPAGGGGSVRLTVLGIILRSAGLPEAFPQAKFCLYLRKNGFLGRVKDAVERAGKDFQRELNNLYVSPVLHDALIAVDAGFKDRQAVRHLLKSDFPLREDITTHEFIETIREVLAPDRQVPCTILVLDEVQLFIADSSERATQVVEAAEALTKQLDGRLLLVGSGQTALSSKTAQFSKLRDRFTIPVELSDADVESVTRRVLLAKRPDRIEEVRRCLDEHAGEISRQLSSTSIASRGEDREVIVDDYPLLPVRRRFWEHSFRALDAAGTSSQLRTQLRIVLEANRSIADAPLGTVVPADSLFEQLQPGLLQQGVLLREINDTMNGLDDGTDDGRLARRICGLTFLIRKLPRQAGIDLGIRATAEMLADLLVSDLSQEGARLRKEVPRILGRLVERGVLLDVDGEYNLQTRESAEWDREFRARESRLVNSDTEVHGKREALLRDEVQRAVDRIKLLQGASKEARRISLHFGDEAPPALGPDVPVWVRDEWSCAQKEVIAAARAAGADSPTLFVFVPKSHADDLKKRLIEQEAAKSTIEFKGIPSNDEGREALNAMKTRLESARAKLGEIVGEVVDSAKAYKGGGAELHHGSFEERVKEGGLDALVRLFPRFKEADHKNWPVAIQRARNGDDSPLQIVEWTGSVEDHPIAREILRALGPGKEGRALRRLFDESPYGWPRDAVDAVLIALHASGKLQVRHKGAALAVGQLDQAKIPTCDFRVETVTLGAQDKLKLRSLFQEAGVAARASDDLSVVAAEFLAKLRSLAAEAGGDAPLPQRPALAHIEDLGTLAGAERLARILEMEGRLRAELKQWENASRLKVPRMLHWERLDALLKHAEGLPGIEDLRKQAEAVLSARQLLDATDRVAPLLKKTAELARSALSDAHRRFQSAYEAEQKGLDANEAWKKTPRAQRERILAEEGATPAPELRIGSDEDLLRGLDAASLPSWREKTDALPRRFANAALKAARLLEPRVQSVRVTSGTLKSEAEVKEWVSRTERDLIQRLKDGPIVIG